jgi:hypothetical protein
VDSSVMRGTAAAGERPSKQKRTKARLSMTLRKCGRSGAAHSEDPASEGYRVRTGGIAGQRALPIAPPAKIRLDDGQSDGMCEGDRVARGSTTRTGHFVSVSTFSETLAAAAGLFASPISPFCLSSERNRQMP